MVDNSFGRSRSMESAETDFPDPDSPTIPSVFPLSRAKEMLFTAVTSRFLL
jgi:hypothetical protein